MKIKWKRLWSSLLVIIMLVSLVPTALAEEGETHTEVTIYHSLVCDGKTYSTSDDLSKLDVDSWTVGDGSFTETVETTIVNGEVLLPTPKETVTEYVDSSHSSAVATWTCAGYLSNTDWMSTIPVSDWSNATVSNNYYIMYMWTRTPYPTSEVAYNFGIAEEGEAAKEGQLPAGAVILTQQKNDLRLGDKYTGDSSVSADVVQGLPVSDVPSTDAFKDVVDFIAYTETTDENGDTVTTWYEFLGWKQVEDENSGAEEEIALFSVEEEADAAVDEPLIVGENNISLVAQWREIPANELAGYATEEGAPALGLTKKYIIDGVEYDSQISQHNTSTATWTQDGENAPLELDSDRQVYYKATMTMASDIATLLDLGSNASEDGITDTKFAGFTINVDLDDKLNLVTNRDGSTVTFAFTCTFLEPTGKILDSNGNEIKCSTLTDPADDSTTVFTVLAKNLPNEFSIPVQWKPGAYDKTTLQEEISLEIAAAKVPGEDEQTVMTTGVITGYIDLTKAGVKESDIVFAILSQNAWKAYYGDADGNISALAALKANEHLKYAIKNLELVANTVYAYVDGPEPDPIVPDWEISKSKTATNLDKNYESKVTLALPSAEEELVSDVVFVLDKSTSTEVKTAAKYMLQQLKGQVEQTSAKVKVGVVIFNKEAHASDWYDLATDYDKITAAIDEHYSGGTNTHAGLMTGKAMLDADTAVSADRKYLIFVSDGITYIFDDDEGNATSIVTENYYHETGKIISSPNMDMEGAMFKYLYKTNIFENTTVSEYLAKVKSWMDSDGSKYWVNYGSSCEDATNKLVSHTNANGAKDLTDDEYTKVVGDNDVWSHANNLDTALYFTATVYQEAVNAGYHCYTMSKSDTTNNDNYPWAANFMDYLANGETVTFDEIQNDIYYLLDAGSKVVDVIGEGTYNRNQYYNFDFVTGAENLTLTVGDTQYTTAPVEESDLDPGETARYTFTSNGVNATNGAEAPFVLHYYAEGTSEVAGEHFVWDINVPVSQFETVKLTYTVRLTNPQTADGTYGVYDGNGDGKDDKTGEELKDNTSLYTNNSATLYPVDSNGNKVQAEEFNKPTVSYTVEPTGTLHISKYVADNEATEGEEYSFSVKLGNQTEEFTLKDGETKTFTGLALGTEYEITETTPKGYKPTYYNPAGEITEVALDAVAAVINVPANEGALVISKTVNGGDLDQAFTFTVQLSAEGEYRYTGSKTGTISSGKTVTLKNGESISINNLPAGTTYTVTETAMDGYTTTISGDDANMKGTIAGNVASGTIVKGAAAVVHYTNTSTAPVIPDVPGLTVTKELTEVNGKTYRSGSVETGDTLTYTITVKNTGNTVLTDIDVTDELPNGLRLVSDDLGRIDRLAVGDSRTFTVEAVVRSSAEGSRLTNTAIATCGTLTVEDDETVRVYEDEDEPYIPPVRPSKPDPKPVTPAEPSKPALNIEDHVAYIIGYEDGTVRPENNITRAEVATIFFRLLTSDSRAYYWSQTNEYSDVDSGDWFNNAVSTLSNAGIVTGYPDGTFLPNAPISRAEFATIAARFSDVVYSGSSSFIDVSASHWAARYIALAEYLGWITGYPDGTFKPDQNITRAEAMTLINRVLERAVEEEHMLPDMVTWIDNLPDAWYYEAVQEATNSHEYVRLAELVPGQDFCYEDWQEIEAVPDWAALEKAWSTANSK